MICFRLSFSLYFLFSLSSNTSSRADDETDDFIKKNHRILNYKSANTRNVQNLQNWIDGKDYIVREKTAYLQSNEELLTLRYSYDSAVI